MAAQAESCPALNNGTPRLIASSITATADSRGVTEAYDTFPAVVDFSGDRILDVVDLVILIEFWGTDELLCDIAPPPDGDGIVDVLDLELFMGYWEQENMRQKPEDK